MIFLIFLIFFKDYELNKFNSEWLRREITGKSFKHVFTYLFSVLKAEDNAFLQSMNSNDITTKLAKEVCSHSHFFSSIS